MFFWISFLEEVDKSLFQFVFVGVSLAPTFGHVALRLREIMKKE
jgi:hypothetical protein